MYRTVANFASKREVDVGFFAQKKYLKLAIWI